jgi:Mrp family chromosome partitioning ATPase
LSCLSDCSCVREERGEHEVAAARVPAATCERIAMDPLRLQLARVRRGAWLVVLVTLFAVAVAGAAAVVAGVSYTGRATLALGSQFRAPEQDAVLASGYADLFNSPGYQQQLRDRGIVEAGVQAAARTAAASPIIYIEAVSRDQVAAQEVASKAADALYADVNTSLRSDRQAKIAGLDAEIEKQRRIRDDNPRESPQSIAAQEAMSSLQNNANELRGDITNELQMLQRDAGVSGSRPNILANVALGGAGGLVLGVLAALALAALRGRAASGAEIEQRFGVRVLAELRPGRSAKARQDRAVRIERFANALGPQGHPRPFVVAVTSPQRIAATARVAHVLAERRAQQGERAIVLSADLREPQVADPRPGVADLLMEPGRFDLDGVATSAGGRLRVVPPGIGTGDPFAEFSADRTRVLVARTAAGADVVTVVAPPLMEASEAQTICGVARKVVLVVDPRATTMSEVKESMDLLARTGAALLGVVVVDHRAAISPELAGEHPGAEPGAGQPTPADPVAVAEPSASQERAPSTADAEPPTLAQPVVRPVDARTGTGTRPARDAEQAASSAEVTAKVPPVVPAARLGKDVSEPVRAPGAEVMSPTVEMAVVPPAPSSPRVNGSAKSDPKPRR